MSIILFDDFRIGGYSRRILIRSPLKLVIILVVVIYVEFSVRIMEASIPSTNAEVETPFFVDRVAPEEEHYMTKIVKEIDRDDVTNEVCLSSHCIEKVAHMLARAFKKPSWGKWCVTSPPRGLMESDFYGLLMVKVPKAASSTVAAVTLRIQNQTRYRTHKTCRIEYNHRLGSSYVKAPPAQSFLWTSIRDPTTRALSRIFFSDVSFKNLEPSDDVVLAGLQRQHDKFGTLSLGHGGFQVKYTTLREIMDYSACSEYNRSFVTKPERVVLSVKRIIDSYGFIALVERMDESLVALSMLLNIPVTDVLISSSKVAGSSYFMRYGKCVKLVKAFVSPAVKEHLESKTWLAQNYGDTLLHMTVNKSLDLTIDQSLGRANFDLKLSEYKRLKALDAKICAPHTILPCSKDGTNQVGASRKNCYAEDFGCGYPCVDEMLKDDKLHTNEQRALWQPSTSWL